MQTIGAYLGDRLGLAIALCLLAAVFIIVILTVLFRLMFGRRLSTAGTRSRQPRLGIVDAFDLDRQRQLVLVRRDNVEHLLMIGGPNDLLIESAFQRAQPTLAVPAGRDKEGVMPAAAVVPMPLIPSRPEPDLAASDARPQEALAPPGRDDGRVTPPPLEPKEAVVPADLGPLADIPAPGPVGAPFAPPPDVAPSPVASTPVTSPQITSPDFTAPAATPSRPFTSRLGQPLPSRTGVQPPRQPLNAPRTPAGVQRPPSLLPNRPMPLIPLQRGTSAASLRRDPPPPAPAPEGSAAPNAEEGAPPVQAPTTAANDSTASVDTGSAVVLAKPAPALPLTLESIESLEEEMAKLLGRGAADKS